MRMILTYKEASGSFDVNKVDTDFVDFHITECNYLTTDFDSVLETFLASNKKHSLKHITLQRKYQKNKV